MSSQQHSLRAYFFPLTLILSIILGGMVGYLGGAKVQYLKPLGDIFLNLIFTTIVPLIFFSVASAIAKTRSVKRFGKIFFCMMVVFILTGIIAALSTLLTVKYIPLAASNSIQLSSAKKMETVAVADQLVAIFSVPDFKSLLSHEHILALIVFSILVGFATSLTREKTQLFEQFLQAGEAIFMRVFSLIMYYAPLGFFAYFAVLVQQLGPTILGNYLEVAIFYYVFALVYFFVVYSAYAYWAGKREGLLLFWKNIFLPLITAIATCSSAASIPANLAATRKMQISPEIYETVVPLGAIIHKDGSVIGGVVKIAFLFSVFHLDFSGLAVLLLATTVSLLVGTVMGAIPSGGMLGELLILAMYGFPSSALLVIAAISIIVDPIATMLNVTGNTVSSMLIARLVEGKDWLKSSVLAK